MSYVDRPLNKEDIIMRDDVLRGFELPEYMEGNISLQQTLDRARRDMRLLSELLSCTGTIFYAGRHAQRYGVVLRDGGTRVVGNNAYGEILMQIRDILRREVYEEGLPVVSQRPDQVHTPFVTAHDRDLEAREAAEAAILLEDDDSLHTERDIRLQKKMRGGSRSTHAVSARMYSREEDSDTDLHVEPVSRSAVFHDTDRRNGTTGHVLQGTGAAHQVWSCPFGVDARYPVRVGSEAEASLLFERGLRGELDYKVLISSLRERHLLSSRIPERDVRRLFDDIRSQFAWMRTTILRDSESLSEKTIISDGTAIADGSFGRSLHDPVLAPAPADVLAHYINNPWLLSRTGYSLTASALQISGRDEVLRFVTDEASGVLTVLVDGSDTVGGRVPGTRAVRSSSRDKGRCSSDRYLQFKTDVEIQRDYAAFASRMDSILGNLPSEMSVRFVTGTGVGIPAMVKRYVSDHGGNVLEWDYRKGKALSTARENPSARFSVVRMSDFDTVFPVLAGRDRRVTFLPRSAGDGEVTFEGASLRCECAVSYPVTADVRNRDILLRAGLLADCGLPLVVVTDNESETAQLSRLEAALGDSRDDLFRHRMYEDSLFGEGVMDWSVEGSLSSTGKLFQQFPSPAFVAGMGFSSVYTLYAALLMDETGGSLSGLDALSEQQLLALTASAAVSDEVRERCMRNAVHGICRANADFADWLFSTGAKVLLAELSTLGQETMLFTDMSGHGGNRWGLVLMSERDSVARRYAMENAAAEELARDIAAENARRQRRASTMRAQGEKVTDGLPDSVGASADAVWLLGTNDSLGLSLPVGGESVQEWVQEGDHDYLCRELASRRTFSDGMGGEVLNRFVFVFPTDRLAVTGRRHVSNFPDSRDLTGVRRVDAQTGEDFVCAFGIPVRRDDGFYEEGNVQGRVSSFLNDHDAGTLQRDIVNAHAQAVVTALQKDLALCYARSQRRRVANVEFVRDKNGVERPRYVEELNDDLSRVFNAVVYDYPRVPADAPAPDMRPRVFVARAGEPGILDSDRVILVSDTPNEGVRERADIVYSSLFGHLDRIPRKAAGVLQEEFRAARDEEAHLVIICDGDDTTEDVCRSLSGVFPSALVLPLSQRIDDRKQQVAPGGIMLREVSKTEFNPLTGEPVVKRSLVSRREYIPSPHAAPRLKAVMKRYIDMLGQSSRYPLNCVRLPRESYADVPQEIFLADFTFTLEVMNAVAIALDRPMRFPLNKSGRLDLGPGVPDSLLDVATRKLDSFISVVREEDVVGGELPELQRVSIADTVFSRSHVYVMRAGEEGIKDSDTVVLVSDTPNEDVRERADLVCRSLFSHPARIPAPVAETLEEELRRAHREGRDMVLVCDGDDTVANVRRRFARLFDRAVLTSMSMRDVKGKPGVLSGDGTDIYVRPTHVMNAFGAFDFGFILSGQVAPMHEMAFRDGDGVFYRITDTRLSNSFTRGEQNRYIRYEKNDECRFRVTSTAPERIPAFVAALRSYMTRAAQVKVDFELVSEEQAEAQGLDMGLEGYVDLLSSNTLSLARPGQMSPRGDLTAVELPNRIDGTERDADNSYYGHRDAGDGFRGWVRYSAVLGDGREVSGFIEDRELALQLVLSKTLRLVSTDQMFVPERRILDCLVRAYAIRENGFHFRSAEQAVTPVRVDNKTVTLGFATGGKSEAVAEAPVVEEKPCAHLFMALSGDSRLSGDDVIMRICPTEKAARVDIDFQSIYPSEGLSPGEWRKQVLEPGAERIAAGVREELSDASAAGRCVVVVVEERFLPFADEFARFLERCNVSCMSIQERVPAPDIVFIESQQGYAGRTEENAAAADLTVQIAADFRTTGERQTSRAAVGHLLPLALPLRGHSLDCSPEAVEEAAEALAVRARECPSPLSVNLAGNGMYTLAARGVRQEELDVFIASVFVRAAAKGVRFGALRSGGQTGVDESVAAVASCLGLPAEVHAPKSWVFRGANGANVSGREAFVERFRRDWTALHESVQKVLQALPDNRPEMDSAPSKARTGVEEAVKRRNSTTATL